MLDDKSHTSDNETESRLERRSARVFTQARQLVEHEDDLVDRRLKWLITISGFLFVAYGASFLPSSNLNTDKCAELFPEIEGDCRTAAVVVFARLAMAILGVVNCLTGTKSIQAAHLAIAAISRKYKDFLMVNKADLKTEAIQVFRLIGDDGMRIPGASFSFSTPYMLAGVWIALIALSAVEFLSLFLHAEYFPAVVFVGILSAGFGCLGVRSKARRANKHLEKSGRESQSEQIKKSDEKYDPTVKISNDSFSRPVNAARTRRDAE